MTMKEYGQEIYANAQNKGFYDKYTQLINHPSLSPEEKEFIRYLWRANRLMLIVSELAEGLEGLRNKNMSAEPGSGGFVEELGDAGIRLLDLFVAEGQDPEAVIAGKMSYNAKRSRMHGGKVA